MAAPRVKAAARKQAWTLLTDDTRLTVGVSAEGQLGVFELSNPAVGWNWTPQPSVLPFVDKALVGGVDQEIRWRFAEGLLDASDGQKLTLRFICEQPALELTSEWSCCRITVVGAMPKRTAFRRRGSRSSNRRGPQRLRRKHRQNQRRSRLGPSPRPLPTAVARAHPRLHPAAASGLALTGCEVSRGPCYPETIALGLVWDISCRRCIRLLPVLDSDRPYMFVAQARSDDYLFLFANLTLTPPG
jgi:hypothetical protein